VFTLESRDSAVTFVSSEDQRLQIAFMTPSIARIRCTAAATFSEIASRIVVTEQSWTAFQIEEADDRYTLASPTLRIELSRANGALSYRDGMEKMLFREPERGGRWLMPKPVYRNLFRGDAAAAFGLNIDGARAVVTPDGTVFDRDAYEAKLEFVFSDDEALYGLGSHEEGYGNLRGRSRELYQQNMKAVVPYFVSTRGYGVLLDCCSLMSFHDDALGSYWWADAVDELRFYVIAGESFDEVTRGYYVLTGATPMLPRWTLGYLQSKERYVNADELLEIVKEYRRRKIPLDAVILDWKSWPNGAGWGQKSLDPLRFPEPGAMMHELHAMGARLMVSIWPIMTGGAPNQRELLARGFMLGNHSTYNAFDAEARAWYWQQAKTGLFDHGVDGWWCDCTEPFEADWSGAVKPEQHLRVAINTEQSKLYLDAAEINAYSLAHSQGIYEGQRGADSTKRVVNLTRSSYAGQHRYGTITWSGDICATWETLRRSIPEGLNFCAAGEPYWTVDIGGFFVNYDRRYWFWRGDYPAGCRGLTDMNALTPDPSDDGSKDLGYWELYTRWVQYAVFLPLFRSHGTDVPREIWRFGEEGSPFYDAIATFIRLRYRLLPYLYSLVSAVTRRGTMMMRALALEFPADRATHCIGDQYLLGPALMVCPVTRPMYYDVGSRALTGVSQTRSVYLPEGCAWFDFWTSAWYAGGQTLEADAPLDRMPLYVRAGSIVPMTEVMQFTDETPDAPYEIRVYCGADAGFELYEDAGDGYEYETGAFALIRLEWSEAAKTFTLARREGEFPLMVKVREYRVVFISAVSIATCVTTYVGERLQIQLNGEELSR
jgi:alpha-D-xyloside xylohydrolase